VQAATVPAHLQSAESLIDSTSGQPIDAASTEVLTGTSRREHDAVPAVSSAPARSMRLVVASIALLGVLGVVAYDALRDDGPATEVSKRVQAPVLAPEPEPAAATQPAAAPLVIAPDPPPSELRAPEALSPAQRLDETNPKDPRATRRRSSPGFVASPGF
jgi:hypothetical protein